MYHNLTTGKSHEGLFVFSTDEIREGDILVDEDGYYYQIHGYYGEWIEPLKAIELLEAQRCTTI